MSYGIIEELSLLEHLAGWQKDDIVSVFDLGEFRECMPRKEADYPYTGVQWVEWGKKAPALASHKGQAEFQPMYSGECPFVFHLGMRGAPE